MPRPEPVIASIETSVNRRRFDAGTTHTQAPRPPCVDRGDADSRRRHRHVRCGVRRAGRHTGDRDRHDAAGRVETITKTVETPPIPPKPDIFFLADTTGSMAGAIANVRNNAASIMSQVLAAQPDAQFGVGEYKDVGSAFPYRLNPAITASTADAQTGINQWVASGGGDEPEAQLFALQELSSNPATGFRSGSSRIVVWFGDAPGHDPSNGATEASATAALQAAESPRDRDQHRRESPRPDWASDPHHGRDRWRVPPRGQRQRRRRRDPRRALEPSGRGNAQRGAAPPGVFATLTPASQTVTSGGTVMFSETYGVNAGTLAGTYVCNVDSSSTGSTAVRRSTDHHDHRPAPDLAITKTGPALVTEGNNVVYSLTATNNGPTIATGVTVSDPVPAGSTSCRPAPAVSTRRGSSTCTAGTLNPGQSVTFTFTVRAGSGTSSSTPPRSPGTSPTRTRRTTRRRSRPRSTSIRSARAATTGLGDLWPPNHKLVAGQIGGVTDPDGDP